MRTISGRSGARNLPVGDLKGMPQSVPSDLLAGLLDHAATALGRLTVALAAVHAVSGHDIRAIRTADVDLARGTPSTLSSSHTAWQPRG